MSRDCDRSRTALMDVALGGEPASDLQAHLAGCASCRRWLADHGRLIGRIDGELQASLEVMPSPEFLPRLRQRLESPADAPQWWRMDRLVSAAIVVALLAAGFLRLSREPVPPSAPSRAEAGGAPSPPSTSREPTTASPRSHRTNAVHPRSPSMAHLDPEVLVPPGQEALLRRVIEPIRSGRLDLASFPEASEASVPEEIAPVVVERSEVRELGIEPIEIKPLTMAPNEEEES
jgi:hypothetical protein